MGHRTAKTTRWLLATFPLIAAASLLVAAKTSVVSQPGPRALWPKGSSGRVEIPILAYALNKDEKEHLEKAERTWEATGRVSFRRLSDRPKQDCAFLLVTIFGDSDDAGRCKAKLGFAGSENGINILTIGNSTEAGCERGPFLWHDIAHEIGHTLGLDHEHQRADRKKFLDLTPAPGTQFLSWVTEDILQTDVPTGGRLYSFDSIMHYPLVAPRHWDVWDPPSKAPANRAIFQLTEEGKKEFARRFPGKNVDFIGGRREQNPISQGDLDAVAELYARAIKEEQQKKVGRLFVAPLNSLCN